jgi:dCMP deaminase
MVMKDKFIHAYMDVAERFAQLSTAKKLQVGSVIVKDNRIISIGYNGTPSGWDNECEEHVIDDVFKTKPEVIHAEMNALMKLARSPESGEGAALFVTHFPCIECAKCIYQAGISIVYYRNQYEASKGCGWNFLNECNIETVKVNAENI